MLIIVVCAEILNTEILNATAALSSHWKRLCSRSRKPPLRKGLLWLHHVRKKTGIWRPGFYELVPRSSCAYEKSIGIGILISLVEKCVRVCALEEDQALKESTVPVV